MFIYLAHPIDQVDADHADSKRLKRMILSVETACAMQGISTFRPGRAYSLNRGIDQKPDPLHLRAIDAINNSAIWESSGVIAILAPGVPTLGVPVEIEQALTLNRPTVIITTNAVADYSVQLTNWMGRGAQIRLTDEDGGWWFGEPPSLPDALRSLPDPTKLTILPEASDHPDLIIRTMSTQAKFPTRAYRGDAGLDLAVVGEHDIEPGEYQLLPTGIAAAVPDGWWGFMTGRSSAWARWQFDIRTAVIDSGYRGELMVGVHNRGSERRTIMPGTRLAQYVLLPAFMGNVIQQDELPDHERGTNGYGSSGH